MMTEDALSFCDGSPSPGQVSTVVSIIVKRLFVLLAFFSWIVFWRLIARFRFKNSDFASAGIVGLLFVLPAVIGIAYYVREWLLFDWDFLSASSTRSEQSIHLHVVTIPKFASGGR